MNVQKIIKKEVYGTLILTIWDPIKKQKNIKNAG
jgi:hypothetical protein